MASHIGRGAFRMPTNWSLLGRDELRHPDNFRANADSGFAAVTFEREAIHSRRLVVAVRGSDDKADWAWNPLKPTEPAGPNMALAADGDLVGLVAGVPLGDKPKQQVAWLQQKALPAWSKAFDDLLDYGLEMERKYGAQGYEIEVAGHGMGGGGAQLLSYTFGWGGRTFDAAGAANLIESPAYKAWLKENGVTPKGAPKYDPDSPQDVNLLNYTVNDSAPSQHTGPHIGRTEPITALGGREGFDDYAKYGVSKVAGIPLLGPAVTRGAGFSGPWISMMMKGANEGLDATERHDMDRIIRVFERAAEKDKLQQWGYDPGPARKQTVPGVGERSAQEPGTAEIDLARQAAVPSPTKTSDPMLDAILSQLPAGTSREKAEEVRLAAKIGGIERPDQLATVVYKEGDSRAFVYGKFPGQRADIDLSTPAPTLQATRAQEQAHDLEQAQMWRQFEQQQAQANRDGPHLRLPGFGSPGSGGT